MSRTRHGINIQGSLQRRSISSFRGGVGLELKCQASGRPSIRRWDRTREGTQAHGALAGVNR